MAFYFSAARTLAVAAISLSIPVFATAQDAPELPRTLAWTSFDVGSNGYAQSIAIGKAMQDAYGTQLRVLPMATDQSRLAPARDNRVPYALSGTDTFYAFEGVESYATPDWGPQSIKALAIVGTKSCAALATAADTGIESMDQVAGKRVANVVGSPALQANVRALLAFGDLTMDDVHVVDVPSFGASWQALINGQVDAITSLTAGALMEQGASGPRGLRWVPMPESDTEGWERTQAINPHFSPSIGTQGASMPENGLECAGVPYPVLITYASDDDMDYNVIKAIVSQVDAVVAVDVAATGWLPENQKFGWVLPYSAGAIKYFEEVGQWNAEKQAHNDELLARQQVLNAAWQKMESEPKAGFADKWLEVRAAALEEAGMSVYFQ